MINLEKIKQEKCEPPPHPFKKNGPCTIIFHLHFSIFQIPPSEGGNQNLLTPFKKMGGLKYGPQVRAASDIKKNGIFNMKQNFTLTFTTPYSNP